jgi:hypothetical protein
MKTRFFQFLMACILAAWAMTGHATSPPIGWGDATVWVENGKLCFGAKFFSWKNAFNITRTRSVDFENVVISEIAVYKKDGTTYWLTRKEDGGQTNILQLKSNTCIVYGATLPNFENVLSAKTLDDGQYRVSLTGHSNRQVLNIGFTKTFCMKRNERGLEILLAEPIQNDGANPVCPE